MSRYIISAEASRDLNVITDDFATINRSLAKIQSTPPQPSPRVRGGGKIILVSPLNKGGLRGVNLTFARVLI
jgi:hypothetical protein